MLGGEAVLYYRHMPIVPKSLQSTVDPILKKIRRSGFYYRRYNNTLGFQLNERYMRFAKECAREYARQHGEQHFETSPVMIQCAQVVKGILPKEKAQQYSAKITQLIETNHPCAEKLPGLESLMRRINEPLKNLDSDFLNVFRTPQLHNALLNFFKGNYRIEWISAFRSFPSEQKMSAWTWHSDSFPPKTCKLFIHLTPVNTEMGATEFLSPEDTTAFRDAGYFGQYKHDRLAELDGFAKEHNLPYRPLHYDADAGDGSLFNMNFFHRAKAPKNGFRDVIEFFFLPNPIPWDEQLEKDGWDKLNVDDHRYYPKDPAQR